MQDTTIILQILWTSIATSTYDVLFAVAFALVLKVTRLFNFAQAACPVTISGLEQLKNMGKQQIIDLMDARLNVAEASMLTVGFAVAKFWLGLT